MERNATNTTQGNQGYLKRINRLKILNLFRSKGSLSRMDLVSLTNLNNKTITNIVNELLEKRIITSIGLKSTGTGRKKEHFSINSDLYYSIGIDIGASHISSIIINLAGKVLLEKSFTFNFGLKASIVLEKIINLTKQLIEESGIPKNKILGIGFTAPGFFDKNKGIWKLATNIADWKSIPIKNILRKHFHKDIYLQDCSRSMALAELWYGAGKNKNNFLLLDIGQGIGLGIVINGSLYEGSNLKSGEIGHLVIDPKGRKCTCGNRGCLEASASAMAITQIVREKLEKGEKSKIRDLINDNLDNITAIDIVEAANLKDNLCIKILHEAGEKIGIALSYAINLFNPELVILSGQLTNAGKYILDPLIKTAKKYTLPMLFNDVEITQSKLGHLSASLGAATIAINEKVFSL